REEVLAERGVVRVVGAEGKHDERADRVATLHDAAGVEVDELLAPEVVEVVAVRADRVRVERDVGVAVQRLEVLLGVVRLRIVGRERGEGFVRHGVVAAVGVLEHDARDRAAGRLDDDRVLRAVGEPVDGAGIDLHAVAGDERERLALHEPAVAEAVPAERGDGRARGLEDDRRRPAGGPVATTPLYEYARGNGVPAASLWTFATTAMG